MLLSDFVTSPLSSADLRALRLKPFHLGLLGVYQQRAASSLARTTLDTLYGLQHGQSPSVETMVHILAAASDALNGQLVNLETV